MNTDFNTVNEQVNTLPTLQVLHHDRGMQSPSSLLTNPGLQTHIGRHRALHGGSGGFGSSQVGFF